MVKQINLEYPMNGLEPVISEETMNFHYGKHHLAYVNNYNDLVKGTDLENEEIEDVLKNIDTVDSKIKQAIINNGGGASNHNIYFEQFSTASSELSNGKLKDEIIQTFGSIEKMIEELVATGMTTFGSGWSWLVKEEESLKIISTKNQDSPLSLGMTPLLTLDVWEHAYYLQYQNLRKKYLEELFKIINWDVVENRYNK